jgi:hypothetical protein
MKCVEMVTEVISEAEGECGCQSFFSLYNSSANILLQLLCWGLLAELSLNVEGQS